MPLLRLFVMALFLALPFAVNAASGTGPAVSPEAPTLFYVGPLPITNAMVYTWIIAAIIFIAVKLGTRNLTIVPSGLQNAIEATPPGETIAVTVAQQARGVEAGLEVTVTDRGNGISPGCHSSRVHSISMARIVDRPYNRSINSIRFPNGSKTWARLYPTNGGWDVSVSYPAICAFAISVSRSSTRNAG